jgi:hypothetical protein
MPSVIDPQQIQAFKQRLEAHPVYAEVRSLQDLRLFMEHHVYSVWDFMSLTKQLQQRIAPAGAPWLPPEDPTLARFINELVLEEESDVGLPDAQGRRPYASHFELYCTAMREVGADDGRVRRYLERVRSDGIGVALAQGDLPEPARAFNATTFGFIHSGQPHVVAAALALGREHIIPAMFRVLLSKLGVPQAQAPNFHYYLERHIHLDEDAHGPMSLHLLEHLCGDDPTRIAEAVAAAEQAVAARERFWDGVLIALQGRA